MNPERKEMIRAALQQFLEKRRALLQGGASDHFTPTERAIANVIARPDAHDHFAMLMGRPVIECWRGGRLIWCEEGPNLLTTVGRDTILDVYLGSALKIANWYQGLIAGPTPTLNAADTMASHAGWTESAAYNEATRPAYTPGAVSGQSIDNLASRASFSINATVTISGTFLVSDNTKSGTTGTLNSMFEFAADRNLENNDTLNVGYTFTS